ncbi:MAG: OmpH family outer membrane protein [Rhodospirillales bacterium]|nr:OmpH family outer membrane protein [Rhodospirillales bacterium]
MNGIGRIVALTAALSFLAMGAGVRVAWAQGNPPATNIAVVDMNFVLENSDPAKNLQAQIEKARGAYQQEVQSKQDEIEKLGQSIERERPGLSEDALQQRMRALRQKIANNESDMQERQSKLEAAFLGAPEKIIITIEQLVDEVRKERNYALVLPRSIIVGTPQVPDITQDVLKLLNQRMPSVAVNIPK